MSKNNNTEDRKRRNSIIDESTNLINVQPKDKNTSHESFESQISPKSNQSASPKSLDSLMGLGILSGQVWSQEVDDKIDQIRKNDFSLTQVDFSNLELSSTENNIFFLKTLASAIKDNEYVTALNISNNEICDSSMKSVVNILKRTPNIKSLNLENCSIDGEVFATLLSSLIATDSLKLEELKLGGNEMDDLKDMIYNAKSNGEISQDRLEKVLNIITPCDLTQQSSPSSSPRQAQGIEVCCSKVKGCTIS